MIYMFYVKLQKATAIKRDKNGVARSWQAGDTIISFRDSKAFADYVKQNLKAMRNVVAFSPSASMLDLTNSYIAKALIDAKLLRMV